MSFNFQEDYILEDSAVRLLPLTTAHFEHLLVYAINEPDIWQFNAGGAEGADRLRQYITKAVEQRQQEKEYAFIVFDKRANQYVGSTRFYNVELERKVLDLGFSWYGKQFQGTGINRHCKYLLFRFAFEQLGMERIGLGANNKNLRSINAMKAVGCTVEGVLRSRGYDAHGQRIDSIVLSILKSEWENGSKEQLITNCYSRPSQKFIQNQTTI